MSIENPYSVVRGWNTDPDGRYDRSPGPVTVRKMTEEEIKKYGIAVESEDEDMKVKLEVDDSRIIEICREHGTGIVAAKEIAKEFGLTDRQAMNLICNRGIKKLLQQEAAAKIHEAVQEERIQSDINSHEDHPEMIDSESGKRICPDCIPAKCETCDGIPEEYTGTQDESNIAEVAEKVREEVSKVARDSIEKIKLSQAVDEMMELVPDDSINHPAHYVAGGIEVTDYIQAKLTYEQFEGFCIGVIIQYVSRYRMKGGIEDLKKAQWYLDRIIGVMETAS